MWVNYFLLLPLSTEDATPNLLEAASFREVTLAFVAARVDSHESRSLGISQEYTLSVISFSMYYNLSILCVSISRLSA